MWIIVLAFGVATLLLAWLLFGYIVWLRFVGDMADQTPVGRLQSFPLLSVVVPCMNEAQLIAEKYRNLMQSDYPADCLEIVFADGGSTDDTMSILRSIARENSRVHVVSCPVGGKINQLNHVLPTLSGGIVVVTDADARLEPDALKCMAAEFESRPSLAVVGAYTTPREGLSVERCFWAAQNRIRLLESRVSHVSMVIACCYAFRRSLLSRFPDDVVADDVYITALANAKGLHTIYCAQACVEELRTPSSLPEFFTHKFRKSNAVLRETLRFAYCLPDMDTRWKSILSTRIVQQLLLPWGTVMWLALAAILVNLGQYDVPALGAGVMLVALLATRKATTAIELPGAKERFGILTVILAYAYTMIILCATALTYLSFRQSSRYARLTGPTHSADRSSVEPAPTGATEEASQPTLPRGAQTVELGRAL